MIVDTAARSDYEPCLHCGLSETTFVCKRKCPEIRGSPSMMWKRSIVQGYGTAVAALVLLELACLAGSGRCADLVIEIPGSGAGGGTEDGGHYRLDYRPAHGTPAPNYTVPARASTINFQGLPGTKYHFMLYYSNATFADLLTWNQTIITAPEPPTNLTVTLGRNKQADISWAPPAHGDYTGFRFKVVPLTERAEGGARNLTVGAGGAGGGNWSLALRELAPGATYQLHAFTLLHDKESAAYASRNFTTKPNTPGKFIVWFRNETTLLVLWQPPYPPGFYTHYKVSIVPGDARESELYVEKEGEPPGPAQAAFKGLVPGRAYNISVQTVSEPEISAPTTAQYRTVPLRPRNVTVPPADLGETSFRVSWLPPLDESEFEKYQVSVSGESRRLTPAVRPRSDPPTCTFEGLEPGAHYTVTVKTMSGKVTSWPATADLTLKPLPVRDVTWREAEGGEGALAVRWRPAEGSSQDSYRVTYQEAGEARDDGGSLATAEPRATLDALLPGRNYTVAVRAVSRGVDSEPRAFSAATRPLAPVVAASAPAPRTLRLAWRSDVTSRQDSYRVRVSRVSPGAAEEPRDLSTAETGVTLDGLFPGAAYEVRVAAARLGLVSEERVVLQPVRPLPPRDLRVASASSDGAAAEWAAPARAASALGGFLLRYRPAGAAAWTALPPLPADATGAEIANMTHGERYTVELDSLSEAAGPGGDAVPSGEPLAAEITVRPTPVSNVAALVEARNVTLEWPRGAGRVERYELRWAALEGAGRPGRAAVPAPPPPAPTVRAVLPALAPGVGYSIAITALSYNLTSDEFTMETRTRPLIQSEMTIVNEAGDDDPEQDDTPPSILVTYTPTPAEATLFDSYQFRLEGGEGGEGGAAAGAAQEASRGAAEPARRVPFGGLTPGALYNVTMWTVSRGVRSAPVARAARLFPRAVARVAAARVGPRGVTLAWPAPRGVWSEFEVQYLAAADTLRTLRTSRTELAVGGLRPHTLYTFTVVTRAGAAAALQAASRGVSVRVATLQAPPPAPRRFRLADAAPSRLDFLWELPPDEANGELLRFLLTYAPTDDPAAERTLHFPPDARSGSVEGLAPGGTYRFRLAGETGAGVGPAATLTQRMRIGAPPPPPADARPVPARATPTTVAVRFRADSFSPANGNVTAYTLVVAEDPGELDGAGAGAGGGGALPSWRDVQRLARWPPYQATEPYFPFGGGGREEQFTLGSERCDAAGGRAYCNGPLKPGTRYFVKLRAFTAPDQFTDTGYTAVHTEADNTAWIIGACVGAALVCAGGAAAVGVRRRRAARAAAAAPPAPPAPRTSRPVRVVDFIDHYRLMSADSDFRFSEEFEELKQVGREQPCSAADLPVNRPKNRFTNILPYDHSRFKLQPVDDEEGSDYINANFVPGFRSPREFIVTQGPLHSTRDDFWRMCWEAGSRAIVMLTRCVEKGREKCDRYWPYDTRPVYYGDIAVTALNESRFPDWTVTELLVARGADQRVVLHFHFTTWPDFGVPSPPTTLARFVRAFRERVEAGPAGEARPVVVHCSAGVGRSGTFVALDAALQRLARGADSLDVFGLVHALRRERAFMVQTEQQYICIHQCLAAALEGQDLAPPPLDHHHNPAFEDDEGIAESGM